MDVTYDRRHLSGSSRPCIGRSCCGTERIRRRIGHQRHTAQSAPPPALQRIHKH